VLQYLPKEEDGHLLLFVAVFWVDAPKTHFLTDLPMIHLFRIEGLGFKIQGCGVYCLWFTG